MKTTIVAASVIMLYLVGCGASWKYFSARIEECPEITLTPTVTAMEWEAYEICKQDQTNSKAEAIGLAIIWPITAPIVLGIELLQK